MNISTHVFTCPRFVPAKPATALSFSDSKASRLNVFDRVEIRFSGKKDGLNPTDIQSEFKQARVSTANLLKVPAKGGDVELDALRQAFYDHFYDYVAKALIDLGEEYYQDRNLYNMMPDMNLTEDDYCCGWSLLHYAFENSETINSAMYTWADVLGYESFDACEADRSRFLKGIAARLGINDPNPTDKMIIGAFETRSVAELRKFRKALKQKPVSIPAPVIKMAFKKAIHTEYKPAVPDVSPSAPHPFRGKTFVLTGILPTLSRKTAEEKIKAVGGKISSSVSHKTDFVLAGEKPGGKLGLAQALKIDVLDESAFLEKLK